MTANHIAFIGLGAMGRSMALHLANKRESELQKIVALDADPARLEGLAESGLLATLDRKKIAGAEVLFLCLPDGYVVEKVLFGDEGVAAGLATGAVVVDHSTIAHGKTLEISGRLAAEGKRFIDAPVSGAPAGAAAGTLTIMCGGDPATFSAVRPLLARMGTNVLHMGATGSGQLTKTINNVIYDINIAALAEVLPMGVTMGLDPEKLAEVVTTGTSRSYASQYFVPRILKRLFDEGYPMAKAYKDLVNVAALAAEGNFPLPVTAAATATYQTALRQGHGNKDKGAMVLPFEGLLKVQFAKG
ncbi:3-hydroxyisobutyrate dehydrogenase-like beta-hydroxyacid dehydrogenase [Bradyrhizobium sp. USDA 4341]